MIWDSDKQKWVTFEEAGHWACPHCGVMRGPQVDRCGCDRERIAELEAERDEYRELFKLRTADFETLMERYQALEAELEEITQRGGAL